MKKKGKLAVALKYDQSTDEAPKIIAKGSGEIAEKILDKGKSHNISVYESEDLTKSLYQLDIGAAIPEEYYSVVAEILAFIIRLDEKKGELDEK